MAHDTPETPPSNYHPRKRPAWDVPTNVIKRLRFEKANPEDIVDDLDELPDDFEVEENHNIQNGIEIEEEILPRIRYHQVLKILPTTVPYVTIACPGEYSTNVYLRVFPEDNLDAPIDNNGGGAAASNFKNKRLMGTLEFLDLKRHAESLVDKFHMSLDGVIKDEELGVNKVEDNSLWVDKYEPQSYLDLLSEESVNKKLLYWLKIWDKTVFGNDFLGKVKMTKDKYLALETKEKEKEKFKTNKYTGKNAYTVEDSEYDTIGRPMQKVALLCGPPGLGKTTCAHIVAKNAGYDVKEINGSDDRSVEAFKRMLDATESQSEMLQKGRPNLLLVDEIDGSPAATINVLVDLITDKATESGKNKAKKILRRPIICICNDLYTPALKSLRKHCLILQFNPMPVASIVDRLQQISLKENMNLDNNTIHTLAEKSECDIRSCLSTMQFLKRKKVTTEDAIFSQLGNKDKVKGIFNIWSDIFTMPDTKKHVNRDADKVDIRFNNILQMAHNFGDYEKLFAGVFENYLRTKIKDSTFQTIIENLEWSVWFDNIRSYIDASQNYSMYSFLPIYFVTAHMLMANRNWFKLQYPNMEKMLVKAPHFANIVKTEMAEIPPRIGRFLNHTMMVLDVLPFLTNIIQPGTIRPVPTQMWSARERQTLQNVVDIMISYNLGYTQQRSEEGSYSFSFEPDVEALTKFPNADTTNKRQFAYAVKQLVAREIETEKLRRSDFTLLPISGQADGAGTKSSSSLHSFEGSANTQNIQSQFVNTEVEAKDFFGRVIIPKVEDTQKTEENRKRQTGVYFRYTEGYSNAVRRYLKVKDFL